MEVWRSVAGRAAVAAVAAVAVAVVAAGGLAACGRDDPGDVGARSGGGSGTTTLRVFAATSLRVVFDDLAAAFEGEHEDVEVEVTYGGSSGLAAQIEQGAPADVFASADLETMRGVVPEDAAPGPVVFARNRLALVVEPGNPEGIRSLRDLTRPGLVVVLCAPAVPCGRLAAAALAAAGVGGDVEPRSLEEHVAAVRSRVELGEADAGIVYATDVLDAGDAVSEVREAVFDDPSLQAVYPVAVLPGAPADAAASWVAFLRSPAAQEALARRGFLAA